MISSEIKRIALLLMTSSLVMPAFAQVPAARLDDGLRPQSTRAPTFLEETQRQRVDTVNRPSEKRLEFKPKAKTPLNSPLTTPLITQKPSTDERGLRQTLIDRPLQSNPQNRQIQWDDNEQKQRLTSEENLRLNLRMTQVTKEAPKKARLYGPTIESQAGHLMAVSSNPRTGQAPSPRDRNQGLSTTEKKPPKQRIGPRREILLSEAQTYRRNSPLYPLQRAIPAKPFDVPMDLRATGTRGGVANPYVRGAVIDPASGRILPKIVQRTQPVVSTLSSLSRDQGQLRPFVLDNDAFVSAGIRSGAFVLKPTLDVTGGYDSNPLRASTATSGSFFTRTRAGLQANSDFSRHALNFDVNGSLTKYSQAIKSYRPELTASANAMIDIKQDQNLSLDLRYQIFGQSTTGSDYSSVSGVTVKGDPLTHVYGAGARYSKDYNRVGFSLGARVDRTSYETVSLSDNTQSLGRERDFNTLRGTARIQYRQFEELRPFIEGYGEKRVFDQTMRTGIEQGSSSLGAKVGLRFDQIDRIVGEVAVGYASRQQRDPSLQDLRGMIFDAGIVYSASGLTNITFKAGTAFDESVLTSVSTIYRRDVSLQIDHAFRRYLIGTARVGFGYDTYVGTSQINERMQIAAGLAYRFNNDVSVAAELRHDTTKSSSVGSSYKANLIMLSVKVAR